MGSAASIISDIETNSCHHFCLEQKEKIHYCVFCGVSITDDGIIRDHKLKELSYLFSSLEIEIELFASFYDNCCLTNADIDVGYIKNNWSINSEAKLHVIVEAFKNSIRGDCVHPFVEKWNDGYHCCDCKQIVEDNNRLEIENAVAQKTLDEDALIPENETYKLGVTINWLYEFTNKFNLWSMPTWKVRRYIILPATASRRCRFAELPEMQETGAVGPADSFVSHTWGAMFGDLVKELVNEADRSRKLWLDIIAVRQWPSSAKEFDFVTTIKHCKSFIVVCTYSDEIANFDWQLALNRRSDKISMDTRKKISFFRVWCLVEVDAALRYNLIIVVKCGDNRELACNMLNKLCYVMNIRFAEATVPADRVQILEQIEKNSGGLDGLNDAVRGATAAGWAVYEFEQWPIVQSAACGDPHAIQALTSSCICPVAGGGYVHLLQALITKVADINTLEWGGWTPLMYAASSGQKESIRVLLTHGASVNVVDKVGKTAISIAVGNVQYACLLLLVDAGTSPTASVEERIAYCRKQCSTFRGYDWATKVQNAVDFLKTKY